MLAFNPTMNRNFLYVLICSIIMYVLITLASEYMLAFYIYPELIDLNFILILQVGIVIYAISFVLNVIYLWKISLRTVAIISLLSNLLGLYISWLNIQLFQLDFDNLTLIEKLNKTQYLFSIAYIFALCFSSYRKYPLLFANGIIYFVFLVLRYIGYNSYILPLVYMSTPLFVILNVLYIIQINRTIKEIRLENSEVIDVG